MSFTEQCVLIVAIIAATLARDLASWLESL